MVEENSLTYNQLYADLVASRLEKDVMPPDCFTTMQFAHDIGKKRGRASEILRGMLAAGELESERVLLNGHYNKIYWFPDTKKSNDE